MAEVIDHAQDLPSHEVARCLTVAEGALADLSRAIDELARQHGTDTAARLLGVSRMSVSRWRHRDLPGAGRIEQASMHAAMRLRVAKERRQ